MGEGTMALRSAHVNRPNHSAFRDRLEIEVTATRLGASSSTPLGSSS
jgi:hypothetical protein